MVHPVLPMTSVNTRHDESEDKRSSAKQLTCQTGIRENRIPESKSETQKPNFEKQT
jgi:hypothetical protein